VAFILGVLSKLFCGKKAAVESQPLRLCSVALLVVLIFEASDSAMHWLGE
jgi:hypothetical protein